ncbi:hypothetical protein PILCRDRAFT_88093 [Piloderma croceum F 1598]|uniref:Uncharacterized protein n=1 Tax=Piloderma croceum (strain F 1598) TaxID=765440 RepID=A0A0C3FYB0_PILCF|nr:hypothetical protein PILCRDRAFT_88093 [Piloderma croceum F 1598]
MQSICNEYIPDLHLKFVESDCQELLAVVADIMESSPSQSSDQQAPPSRFEINPSLTRGSLTSLPNAFASRLVMASSSSATYLHAQCISLHNSTLAAQLPHVTPFERLLACNRTFPELHEASSSPSHRTALAQATYGFPGAGGPQGTYHQEGTTVPAVPGPVPFQSPHRLVHESTHKSNKTPNIGKSPLKLATQDFGRVTTVPMNDMGIPNNRFEPVLVYPGLRMHGQQPVHRSVNPVTHQIGALVSTRQEKQEFCCWRRCYGCKFESDHVGNVGRHEDCECLWRNEAERALGDSLTTCRLCHPPLPFSRTDKYRDHVRKLHPMFAPSLSRRKRRAKQTTRTPSD